MGCLVCLETNSLQCKKKNPTAMTAYEDNHDINEVTPIDGNFGLTYWYLETIKLDEE